MHKASDVALAISEIQADIETILNNLALGDEKNFTSRSEAIDFIDFHLVDRINGLLQNTNPSNELERMKNCTLELKEQLEKIDSCLIQRLRAGIRSGECRGEAFGDMIDEYVGDSFKESQEQTKIGYDNLDVFMDSLLRMEMIPAEMKEREPDMVFYQKTPSRIIFEMVDHVPFNKQDVFYDLGSGLGQVAILVNLLTGVLAKGVEFEPAYCNYATACAAELSLPNVEFINKDAREADYSDGMVFFMYTPFGGSILQNVLEKLRVESLSRNIRILTYGPCTPEVARQSWLAGEHTEGNDIYKLRIFRSYRELRR